MQVTAVSDFRDNIKHFMDRVCDEEDEVIIIARPKGKNVVVMSFDAYEEMRKNVHLKSRELRPQLP